MYTLYTAYHLLRLQKHVKYNVTFKRKVKLDLKKQKLISKLIETMRMYNQVQEKNLNMKMKIKTKQCILLKYYLSTYFVL